LPGHDDAISGCCIMKQRDTGNRDIGDQLQKTQSPLEAFATSPT